MSAHAKHSAESHRLAKEREQELWARLAGHYSPGGAMGDPGDIHVPAEHLAAVGMWADCGGMEE